MANTRAVDFGSLIGAQLSALIEAEAEGAEKSAEYIENVGFEKQADGTLKLRMVVFEMPRRDVDGVVRTHSIQVPVLTLVPIPLLTIEEAELEFDLLIEDIRSEEVKTTPPSSGGSRRSRPTLRETLAAKFGAKEAKPRSSLVARLARTSEQTTTTTADLSMRIKIAQSAFPLGIERLINVADLSVEDETDA